MHRGRFIFPPVRWPPFFQAIQNNQAFMGTFLSKQDFIHSHKISGTNGPSALVQVVFGSPQKACSGVGICTVLPANTVHNCSCPKMSASITLTKRGTLRFYFQKTTCSELLIRQHFPGGFFRVESTFAMPEFVCRCLAVQPMFIRAGRYAVQETRTLLTVDFI